MGQTLSNPFSSINGDGGPYFSEHPTVLNSKIKSDQQLGPSDRAKAAIIGAFVADAMSVSSTYTRREDDNENDDDRVIRKFEDQEGISITQVGGETIRDVLSVGLQSPYGDEAFPFLQLISTRGYFDLLEARGEAFYFLKNCKHKDNRQHGIHLLMSQFTDKRTKGYHWEDCANKDNAQFLAIAKVPILVARYAGSPILLEKVEDAVRMYQTNTKVIAACRLSARLLERVVLGHTVPDTLQWAVTLAKLSKLSSSSSKSSVPIINSTISKRGQKFDNENPIDSKILKFDNVLGLDDNEIEFLDSILPIEPEIIPCKSYGSCVNEKRIDCHRYDITPQKYDFSNPKDERYDNNRSNISTSRNQCDGKTCHHPSPDAAINHCRKGNDSKNMGKCKIQSVTISSSEKNQTSHTRHHRRSINRGTSNKSIPFSLAVEEIGVTSELPESLQASLYGLHAFQSYKSAVSANAMTNGDKACRSWLLGAMLAAEQGESAIPSEWITDVLLYSQVSSMASRLAGSNPYFETLKERKCKLSVLLG